MILAGCLLAASVAHAWTATATASAVGAAPASALASGIERLQAGDLSAARAHLEPLRGSPSSPTAAQELLAALDNGASPAGTTAQAGAAPSAAADPLGRIARAEALLLSRHPLEALEALAPLLAAPPADFAALVWRAAGRAALLAGRFDDAIRWLTAAGPGEAAPTLALARAHYRKGEPETALDLLAPLVAALLQGAGADGAVPRPVQVPILVEFGRIASATGEPQRGVTALERATALDPSSAEAWQALAQASFASGQRTSGERALARLAELRRAAAPRESPDAAELPAQAAADPGPSREAAAAVERALALAREGRREEALGELSRQIAATPAALEPRLLTVSLLLELDRSGEAEEAAEAAMRALPGEAEAVYHRAVVRMIRRDLAGAEADLRRALELAPGHLPALNNLAVLLLQRGRREEARALLDRVLAIDPDNALAAENLSKLESAPLP